MFKIASESFIHALLLFLGLFLKIFRWFPLFKALPWNHEPHLSYKHFVTISMFC